MITIFTLKETITSGGKHYPIYIGLIPAVTLAQVTAVPRFHKTTSNSDIARNVSARPVKEWQRPEIPQKVSAIRMLFNNSGKFMPNPVLLGENMSAPTPPLVRPHTVGGHATPVWEIEINDDPTQVQKPLWILDGQHRIAGLSASAQSSNPVPVVFLLNQGSTYYQPDTLAEVFAEVTTAATPLGPMHKEWLSYAFDLNDYSGAGAAEHRSAMQAVIELCKTPTFTPDPNPYFDKITFNEHATPARPAPGGHPYNCKELKDIVHESYFSAQKNAPELTPVDLAREMCRARRALETVISSTTTPSNSVFFGDDAHHQKIMEDAFWHGVLTHLCHHPRPASWTDVLRTLKFDLTSWDFSWKKSLHGREQSRSKNLSARILGNAFRTMALPAGIGTIADYLRGNAAEFQLHAYKLNTSGKLDRSTITSLQVKPGNTVSFPVGNRVAVKVPKKSITENIEEIVVTDKNAPPGTLVRYDLLSARGLMLDPALHKSPLELLFTLHHYGGVTSTANIDVVWTP